MISHVNADLRVGPLNYVLIGTETHRYHHAAEERGNYGPVIPLWDIVFGTFIYEPTRVPASASTTPAPIPTPHASTRPCCGHSGPRRSPPPPPARQSSKPLRPAPATCPARDVPHAVGTKDSTR
jgi:Fatty acid hydroxylase